MDKFIDINKMLKVPKGPDDLDVYRELKECVRRDVEALMKTNFVGEKMSYENDQSIHSLNKAVIDYHLWRLGYHPESPLMDSGMNDG